MSGFIGAALPRFTLQRKDDRLAPIFLSAQDTRDRTQKRHDIGYEGFYNEFWPGNRGFIGDRATDVSMTEGVWGRRMKRFANGVSSRLGFVGITRDENGNILAGVTCSLFRTATKAWIMDVVSDANGAFLLQTFYSPDTHFIVFWKAGSPNKFDATDQTLMGA